MIASTSAVLDSTPPRTHLYKLCALALALIPALAPFLFLSVHAIAFIYSVYRL